MQYLLNIKIEISFGELKILKRAESRLLSPVQERQIQKQTVAVNTVAMWLVHAFVCLPRVMHHGKGCLISLGAAEVGRLLRKPFWELWLLMGPFC